MVDFGVYIPQVALGFDDLERHALRCEALGFTSMWLYDHLYSPGLPNQPSLEGWTAATALLARTTRLRVGHLVLNNNFRHPALLGRMIGTLDVISGGRLDVGIGSGSYPPEHEEGGFPWGSMAERSGRLEEALEIITRMFGEGPVSFEGRHYRVAGVPNLPPPVQRPHPPIHIGGTGERYTLPLVARYADVWNVPTYGLVDWPAKAAALDARCEEIGRDPATVRRSMESVLVIAADDATLAERRTRAEKRYAGPGWGFEAAFVGTPGQIVDRIGAEVERGMDLFVFFLADRAAQDMPELLAEHVLPCFR